MEIGAVADSSGLNLYALLFHMGPGDEAGKVYDVANAEWVTYVDADRDDYDIAMSELDGSGIYTAQAPNLPTGKFYRALVYDKDGAAPSSANDTYKTALNVGGNLTASAGVVDESRTWPIEKTSAGFRSPKTITLQPGFAGTLAVDLSRVLNPGTGVASVDSVTDEESQTPAIGLTNLVASGDRRHARFDVSNLSDGNSYRLKVMVGTTDGQTLPCDVLLVCEETP